MKHPLDIHVTPLIEDSFFLVLSLDGEISPEWGKKAYLRLKGKYSLQEYEEALNTAQRMRDNVKKYGIPCNEWK